MRMWYGLSDGEIEEQVNDRLSFSRFAGLGMDDTAPDSTTLCRFRNALVKSEVYDKLLSEVNRQLSSRHVMVITGVIVDASVTAGYYIPFSQHNLVPHRYEFILHVGF